MLRPAVVLLALLLPITALSAKEPLDPPAPPEEARRALAVFAKEFKTLDMDEKVAAVERLSRCVNNAVIDRLMRIVKKERFPEIRVAAAKGLGRQVALAKEVTRRARPWLVRAETKPEVLAALVRSVGEVGARRLWREVANLAMHPDDSVVVACFRTLGSWKELRAHREILHFWTMYPRESKWDTGAVSVNKGGDQAARLKWMKLYGDRSMRRPRPECVRALMAAVLAITGKKMEKPAEFAIWIGRNQARIRAAESRRS